MNLPLRDDASFNPNKRTQRLLGSESLTIQTLGIFTWALPSSVSLFRHKQNGMSPLHCQHYSLQQKKKITNVNALNYTIKLFTYSKRHVKCCQNSSNTPPPQVFSKSYHFIKYYSSIALEKLTQATQEMIQLCDLLKQDPKLAPCPLSKFLWTSEQHIYVCIVMTCGKFIKEPIMLT